MVKEKNIIVDTNAFIAISDFKLDIFSAIKDSCNFKYKLLILEGTIKELEKISESKKAKERKSAKLALQIIEQKLANKELSLMEDHFDNVIVDDNLVYESGQGNLILTQDRDLKKRLQRPFLTIRQKKFIVMLE